MPKTLKTSAIDRKCAFPECKRLLSIYNHVKIKGIRYIFFAGW